MSFKMSKSEKTTAAAQAAAESKVLDAGAWRPRRAIPRLFTVR